MTETTRLFQTPAGVPLCRADDLAEGDARNFVLQMRAGRFHGFIVVKDGAFRGYVDQCPHAGLPLARQLDDYLTPGGEMIACGWHGAIFRIDNGLCVGGPCVGQSLRAWPVELHDGWIRTAAGPEREKIST